MCAHLTSSNLISNSPIPCPQCRGSGRDGVCGWCGGRGVVIDINAGGERPCPRCNGTGVDPGPCQWCGGTGVINS